MDLEREAAGAGPAWRGPRRLVFGEGAAPGAVIAETRVYGGQALLVLDPAFAASALRDDLLQGLGEHGVKVVEFVPADPEVPVAGVGDCVAAGGGADVVIALGGGSALDLGKVTALLLAHGGDVRDYLAGKPVPGPVVPLIAVPTTAGTGSEVTPVAVVSPDAGGKTGIASRWLVPEVAVVDPRLIATCPPSVAAYSGVDALCHAVEAFTAPVRDWPTGPWDVLTIGKNPASDRLALQAVGAISGALARVVDGSADATDRSALMSGATTAGLAFGTAGVGVVHALQYALAKLVKAPHGLGVGILLPAVLECLRPAVTAELRTLAGVVAERHAVEDFVDWVRRLNARIGIPASVAALGVTEDDVPTLAADTVRMERLVANTRGPVTEELAAEMLRRSLRAS